MTEQQQLFAVYIAQRAMAGLIPLNALRTLCDDEEEWYQYAEIREDIVVALGGLVSLFMREYAPDSFPDNREHREAFERLSENKADTIVALDHNVSLMHELVKDEKRFKRYLENAKAHRNQA